MARMVGLEVQVAVSVRGLPVHRGVKAAIILPSEQDVQEREGSILLDLHCKLDGCTKAVQVAQELLHSAFPQNAEGVINISLSYARPALVRGAGKSKVFKELHIQVGNGSRNRRAHRCTLLLLVEVTPIAEVSGPQARVQ